MSLRKNSKTENSTETHELNAEIAMGEEMMDEMMDDMMQSPIVSNLQQLLAEKAAIAYELGLITYQRIELHRQMETADAEYGRLVERLDEVAIAIRHEEGGE